MPGENDPLVADSAQEGSSSELNGPNDGLRAWWFNPVAALRAAIITEPSMRYALCVVGVVAAIAIIKGFGIAPQAAVFGTILMVMLMTLFAVFRALARSNSSQVRHAGHVLMWCALVLSIATATLLFTSAFFDKPKPLAELFELKSSRPKDSDHITVPDGGSILDKQPDGTPDVRIEGVDRPDESAANTPK